MGTKKVPFLLLFLTRLDNNTQHTLFFETTKMLSMRSSSSCVHHHVRPFAGAAQCNKRHSISMTTRRRHAVVSVSSFSVSDITGPVNDTVNDLKSIEGLKKLGVRVSMYAPATIMASTVFGLFPTMGACMEACGLGAPGGPLASLAGPLLFSTAGQVASVSAGVAGMLGIGGDIPAYLHSLIFLVAAASMWQYTTAGAASVLAINAYAFHYAHMATMLSNCAEVTSRVPYWLMGAVKKIALVGPGLVMAMLQLLPRAMEFASFEKIGFAPPGLLGPIGAAFLHPIVPWIIAISSFICGVGYLIPAISYCSTLMAPYGYALMFMHLYLGLQLLQEVTPYSSLLPY